MGTRRRKTEDQSEMGSPFFPIAAFEERGDRNGRSKLLQPSGPGFLCDQTCTGGKPGKGRNRQRSQHDYTAVNEESLSYCLTESSSEMERSNLDASGGALCFQEPDSGNLSERD